MLINVLIKCLSFLTIAVNMVEFIPGDMYYPAYRVIIFPTVIFGIE